MKVAEGTGTKDCYATSETRVQVAKGFFRTRSSFFFEGLVYKELWKMPYGMVGAVTSRDNASLLILSPL